MVLWAFKDNAPETDRQELLAAIRGLRAKVSYVREIHVGKNFSPSRADAFTHVYVSTFDRREDLERYQQHVEHVPIAARLREAAAKLIAVDLED